MCGFVGFLNSQSALSNVTDIITKMTRRLIHRGPDDEGIWTDEQIALGHRRLAIMDLSTAGHQPMISADGRYVLAYNGEIYNSAQLNKQLTQPIMGLSDTAILLAYLAEYGMDKTLAQLTGMFAFALWDRQEKILYLARDRIGEKPLYYGLLGKTLVFGSELKAITAFPTFQSAISPLSVSNLMQYGYIPAPRSIYENIYKLPPGHFLTITNTTGLATPKQYWSALAIAQKGRNSPLLLTDSEAIQQLDNRLQQIIRQHMIADVATGAFLSGGIDSSTIAALMQTNSTRPIQTFTIGFAEQGYNEAHHARAIAKHLQTTHTELYVSGHDALMMIPKLPTIYDEPFADSSAIPTYFVSQLAKQHVTVALSGDGGDEIFGGYNRYLWSQVIWNKLNLCPYPLRLLLQKVLSFGKLFTTPVLNHKIQKLSSLLSVNSSSHFYQHLISQWQNPNDIMVMQTIWPHLLSQLEALTFTENMMLTDLVSYLPDDIMVKVDRAGMAVSLENRAPFLDHQLIEWAWSLPLQLKIRQRQSKWLLRQVLARYVPEQLIERPKMGFGIPLNRWLGSTLKEWANELLTKEKLEQHGFFKTEVVLNLWKEQLSGKPYHQYQLWPILMFQAWIENKC